MIITSTNADIATITIDRQPKRNALDIAHLQQLDSAMTSALHADVRAIVVTGSGTAFCSGADLDGVYSGEFRTALYRALDTVTSASVPVIAAVNGPAIGAGTQLAIACDLRIVAPQAVFAVPTARNGLAVDPWTVRRLALLAGGATARALLLMCETVSADLALSRGLADRIGSLSDAHALARQIADFAPLSLSYSKYALQSLFEPRRWDEQLDQSFDKCWASEDFMESQRARAERRTPRFAGK